MVTITAMGNTVNTGSTAMGKSMAMDMDTVITKINNKLQQSPYS